MKKSMNKNNLKQFSSREAVIDNNILIDFCELGRLDILFKVFETVEIPDGIFNCEVSKEVKHELEGWEYGVASINSIDGYNFYESLRTTNEFSGLSRCDRLLITIAKQNKCVCSSNDGLLRKACIQHRISFTGTLGIIGAAYELKIICEKEFNQLINKIFSDETSCYISKKTLREFRDKFGYGIQITEDSM